MTIMDMMEKVNAHIYQNDTHQALSEKLRDVGLRATRQRLDIGHLLFSGNDRHVTAESLHDEAVAAGMKISLATIYNALNQFTDVGLLREVLVDPSRTYFDTNTSSHHHFFNVDDGYLTDIPHDEINVSCLPTLPAGQEIEGVDVLIRIKPKK
ncbi:30S ribosomal protein S16 [alpha proteobacterium IMCC14465]|uniref:Ferric uptake regulation protein n=1 Tax=alpha proteobacterium IMCC14465 TaxID=1220535 RepID=J9DVF1_9PROT|nr:30S ribosomal protein S16 [alpha proteobacterium IMCC14465]